MREQQLVRVIVLGHSRLLALEIFTAKLVQASPYVHPGAASTRISVRKRLFLEGVAERPLRRQGILQAVAARVIPDSG
jgi:hypothetical protein